MTRIHIIVPGIAAAQGSKSHVGNGRMVESSKALAPWRESVRAATLAVIGGDWAPIATDVEVSITFRFPRPKGHFGTGRNADLLKPSAPDYHVTKPDVDKLLRGILDALTSAGLWRDDSQVWAVQATKEYAPAGTAPCTIIRVYYTDREES